MKYVTFAEYEAAKGEIINGVEWKEDSVFPNQYGMMSKTYSTIENGNFYEVTDPNTGITEFWSDKHPTSRYYDGRSREEVIEQYEAKVAAANAETERVTAEYEKKAADLISKLTVDLIQSAGYVNHYAENGDVNRNHTNYGVVTKCANILYFLGQEVDVPCYGDGDYLKIPKVVINSRETKYHNG